VAEVTFFIAAFGAIGGAIGVVALRNPFYCVLALVVHLLSLAVLFLLLRAEFVAAAQVVVYAGAVMVLYVFVVAYVGGQEEPWGGRGANLGPIAILGGGALLIELLLATLGSGLKAIDTDGAQFDPAFGSPGQIGELFLTKFLLPFEIASFLLLIAAVGAVMLARRRRGLDAEDYAEIAVRPLPASAGTMAEAVGTFQAQREDAARKAAGKPEAGGW
jgi:NADH:ubiquinone oxidoreductase subunit 6 (subunit J)